MSARLKPLVFENKNIGSYLESGQVQIVFGNRFLTKPLLPRVFPHYDFCFLQQVHKADLVLATSDQLQRADAQYSEVRDQALVIQTADCVPILLHNDGVICAIHAGWRGLAAQIITRSLNQLTRDYPSSAQGWHAYIGPHIGAQSFEVDRDILPELLSGVTEPHSPYVFPHPQPKKAFVSLLALTQYQLIHCGVLPENILAHAIDTYQSPDCASYRRSGGSDVRQYGFIVRL